MNFKPLLYLFTSFMIVSCIFNDDDDTTPIPSAYKAVVMSRTDFENSIKILPATPMKNAGKIYLKDNWMLLGDTHLGFHIYDNSNSESPVEIGFLKIPGATDLAIRNNVIYVNQAVDLVAFSFDPQSGNVTVFKRIKNTFPPIASPEGQIQEVADNEVVVGWIPN